MTARAGARRLAACLWLAAAVGGCGACGDAPAGTSAAPVPPPEPVAPPHHLLLVSIDTLRADHLGCYGYGPPTSPHLDALAAEGIVFENAWTTAPWTLPSHASLLTGLYPTNHGARRQRDGLDPRVGTLAETLLARGFATGSVVNAVFVSGWYGLHRGFESHAYLANNERQRGTARAVTRAGLGWLDGQGERPTFLFLHYFDVHSDYTAVSRFRKLLVAPAGRLRGTTQDLHRLNTGEIRPEPRDVTHLISLYDAGIRQLDHDLGTLFEGLRERGRWDETLLIVTADHGEEFGEHGRFSHGRHNQEVLHVPLIVKLPGSARAGLRIAQPVSLVDVAPTLLAAVGAASAAPLDGRDLSPWWNGASPAGGDRAIFAQTGPFMRDELRSVRAGGFKLILDRDTGERRLYHLAEDPGERVDVAGQHPELADRLTAAIAELDARAPGAGPRVELSAELVERLRELGYVDPGSAPAP